MLSLMFLAPGQVAAITLIAQVGMAATTGAPSQDGGAKQFQGESGRTGKERLGGKASDEQRTDNCKVPLELRGSTPRPDDCSDGASTAERPR